PVLMTIPAVSYAIAVPGSSTTVTSIPVPLSRFAPILLSVPPGFAKDVPKKKGEAAPTTPQALMTSKHLRKKLEVRPPPPPDPNAEPPSDQPEPVPEEEQ